MVSASREHACPPLTSTALYGFRIVIRQIVSSLLTPVATARSSDPDRIQFSSSRLAGSPRSGEIRSSKRNLSNALFSLFLSLLLRNLAFDSTKEFDPFCNISSQHTSMLRILDGWRLRRVSQISDFNCSSSVHTQRVEREFAFLLNIRLTCCDLCKV